MFGFGKRRAVAPLLILVGLGALSASCGLVFDYSGYGNATDGSGGHGATSSGGATGGAGGTTSTSGSSTGSGCVVTKNCFGIPCGPTDDGCGGMLDCGLCQGVPCASNDACGSGHCVDGVCCDTACADLCYACTVAKKGGGQPDGVCGAILPNLDPDAECADEGAAMCGLNGLCDGQGACAKYASGTPCAQTCDNAGAGHATPSVCSMGGGCTQGAPVSCGGYACAGTACPAASSHACTLDSDCTTGKCSYDAIYNPQSGACGTCVSDANCSAGFWCLSGACLAKWPTGHSCLGAYQCTSNVCTGGGVCM